MKIILAAINAKFIHSNLAVRCLKTSANEYTDQIELYETSINQRTEEIMSELLRLTPTALCFSTYIWNVTMVVELAREIKKVRRDLPIWVGGPEVSYDASLFLSENPWIDGVMIGEGETSFSKLCTYFSSGQSMDLEEIPGIVYRSTKINQDEIITTKQGNIIELSQLPFVYDALALPEHKIIYYESSRGCPFNCSYCLSSIEGKVRFRDLELVKRELSFFVEKKVPQVKFVDRTFNCNHHHAVEIIKHIKCIDQGITNFHFEISADLLTQEEIILLNSLRPGLVQLEIGVQSTNPKTVEEIHRTMNLSLVKEKVSEIEQGHNIHQHLDLIAGLPFEDYESFKCSFQEIYEKKPNQLQLGFLKVLKGSYMMEQKKKYQLQYRTLPPYEVLSTKWITYDQLQKIKLVEEMLEVYYNSGQFEVTMKLLDLVYTNGFTLFLELGEYYLNRQLLAQSHSRIRRCEILLEFLAQTKENMTLWKEALTFDLYYRENMKSRPAFASETQIEKSIYRSYCSNKKQHHLEKFHYHFPLKYSQPQKELPDYQKEGVFVLFEYDQRDPLDHQARTTEVIINNQKES